MSLEGGQAGQRGGRQWAVATRRPGGWGRVGVGGEGSPLGPVGGAFGGGQGRAGQGRGGLRPVSSALGFCSALEASGRAGAAAPPPGCVPAVWQPRSAGEASAAGPPTSDAGPLTLPGLRARGHSGGGSGQQRRRP